ncbi:GNAT family N-acetyltransferase [Tomitella fengzijianii]|uniref:GNAT family N-acetyltransferase n=1 Tax=Tomitella fengzijianii TaxID=2597660 RepID=A0A516X3I8_9ACTN|nr:GNAT family N-acetyltransferase [Tomitella fengzijianii]QDQ97583.1 GNAT family N-acetyltransferase [Tomitella fengzijianii]
MALQADSGIVRAGPAHAHELAALAAATFPLACPPGVTAADVRVYVDQNLSAARFTGYLADPERTLLLARDGGGAIAYAMLIHTPPADPAIARLITRFPATEISKFYAAPAAHGTGVGGALMRAVLESCRARGDAGAWLGVNQENARAQRFYRKHGFAVAGTKTLQVGAGVHDDYVMTRAV